MIREGNVDMRRVGRQGILCFLGPCALIVGLLFIDKTEVFGQKNEFQNYNEVYYDQLESDYLVSVKQVVSEFDLDDAGITMTKTTQSSGERAYNVIVNHRNINLLKLTDKEELEKQLSQIPFIENDCTFHYELQME